MAITIDQATLKAMGGVETIGTLVEEFAAALEAHRFTVDVPAPTAHPLIEDIVRSGGAFEIEPVPAPVAPPEPTQPTEAHVKAEAGRRIVAIMPEHEQRNVMAQALTAMQAYGTDPAGWPAELQAVNAAVQQKWAAIKAIRDRSNEIEAMVPIPMDISDNKYWP